MNPATRLYRVWNDVLALKNENLPKGTMQYLGRDRGIFVSTHDSLGRPIISFSFMNFRAPPDMGDFALRSDGSFHIYWYDNDLKHVCANTFLGWGYVARERVLLFDASRSHLHGHPGQSHIDPKDYDNPIPYFRWSAFPPSQRWRKPDIRFHLVPNNDTWRIAIHPESEWHARACRILDEEYDHAARRYLRAMHPQLRRQQQTGIDYSKARMISMLLEPYEPARSRPKEAHHG